MGPAVGLDSRDSRAEVRRTDSRPLAAALGVGVGGAFTVRYADKWGASTGELVVHVGGTFEPDKQWDPHAVLLQDDRFYEAYYGHLPSPAAAASPRTGPT